MSTLKVDTINTSDGTGNITVSRPLSGSGASLTSLPAANLTGTLPAISGASLTNLTAANLTGTLPAISGASLTNLPGGITLGTVASSNSGTAIDFTGIPAGTKRITMNFDDVETNGTSQVMLQLGDAGGFETSGYVGCSVRVSGDADAENARVFTEGMAMQSATGATSPMFGSIILSLLDASTFTWASMAVLGRQDVYLWVASSAKSLSAELTQVRLTTINGSDAFDDGKLNISYE